MTNLLNADVLEELVRQIVRDELGQTIVQRDQAAGRLLTPSEVAEMWSCSPRTVTRKLLDGSLPGVRLGRAWRVRWEDVAQ